MSTRGRLSLLASVAVLAAACSSGGATPSPSAAEPSMAESMAPSAAPSEAMATPIPGGLLEKVLKAGNIVMSTDPQYPPQSSHQADGTYEGFDIDVGKEIAKRLGVDIAFQTPDWDALTAGSWGGRWDFSVGSMTSPAAPEGARLHHPVLLHARPAGGRTDIRHHDPDGLAGKAICVGEATTYLDWINGELDFGTESPTTEPPAGATATTLKTDRLCAEAGRRAATTSMAGSARSRPSRRPSMTACRSSRLAIPSSTSRLRPRSTRAGPTRPTCRQGRPDRHRHACGRHADAMSMKWFGEDLTVKPKEADAGVRPARARQGRPRGIRRSCELWHRVGPTSLGRTDRAGARPRSSAEIARSRAGRVGAFRPIFVLTWLPSSPASSAPCLSPGRSTPNSSAEWASYILGGVPLTIFISVVSIAFAIVLAFARRARPAAPIPCLRARELYVSLVRGRP